MDAIPVLDLMGGRVVQGLRGERQHYRAVNSGLVAGSEPLAVARALCRECGGRVLYVADLDAIAGTGDHRAVVAALHERLGAEPWVDAGVGDEQAASRLLAAGAARVIVGTETLTDLGALRTLLKCGAVPAERLLVSVDIGEHGVLSSCPALAGRPVLAALDLLVAAGATEVILLSLPQVGTGAGGDLQTLRAVRGAFPHLRLVAGGGVRSPDDLRALAAAGADGVLLATALHRGWVTAADLRSVPSDERPITSEP